MYVAKGFRRGLEVIKKEEEPKRNDIGISFEKRLRAIRAILAEFEKEDFEFKSAEKRIAVLVWLADTDESLLTVIVNGNRGFQVIRENFAQEWELENGSGDSNKEALIGAILELFLSVSATRNGPHAFASSEVIQALFGILNYPKLQNLILRILSNIARSSFIGDRLLEEGCFEKLMNVLKRDSKEEALVYQIFSNIAASYRNAERLMDKGFLDDCLEKADTCLDKGSSKDSLLVWLLFCMRNLCEVKQGRMVFCNKRGQKLTAEILQKLESKKVKQSLSSDEEKMIKAALLLQKTVFGPTIHTELWDETKDKLESHEEFDSSALVSRLLSDEIESYKTGNEWEARAPTILADLLFEEPSEGTEIQQSYTVNDDWNGPGDCWQEICAEVENLRLIKSSYVQHLVAAALNSKLKLLLVFGVSKDKKVKGVRLSKEEQDQFRVGIDCALTRGFRPRVHPDFYSVRIVPVHNAEDEDLVVVELSIDIVTSQHYQLINGQLYLKKAEEVKKMIVQEFVVEVLKRDFRENIG